MTLMRRAIVMILFSVSWHFIIDCSFFFFFQAEDGIRDPLVTGVQTCALPIWGREDRHVDFPAALDVLEDRSVLHFHRGNWLDAFRYALLPCADEVLRRHLRVERSEERRVGKECRGGWWRDGYKSKRNRESMRR